MPLGWRILILRLLAATAATLLLCFGLGRLCRLLRLSELFALAAMTCIFGSQMLWATVAHVGNDYLAVPLTLLFVVWLGVVARSGSPRDLLILAVLFSAGLLTKAYFLAFAPVFVAFVAFHFVKTRRPVLAVAVLLVPICTAGPWYLHNRLLYGSFSGTQQTVAGIGVAQALSAMPQIPWVTSTLAFLHWSLWTGNWSFLSFSKVTLGAELVLIGAALVLYFWRFRQFSAGEWWGLAACACFILGLVYQTCVTYIHTHGESLFAEPWYWQGLVCFLWMLAFVGYESAGKFGRVLAMANVVLSAWITAITYVAKLFPLYGGGFQRATFRRVWAWWLAHPTQDLSTVAIAPAGVLYTLLFLLLFVLTVQTAVIVVRLTGRLWRDEQSLAAGRRSARVLPDL
jgi:hypothetical protein